MSLTGFLRRASSSSSLGNINSHSLRAHGKVTIDDSLALLGDQVLQHLNMALMEEPMEFGGSHVVTRQLTNPRGLIFKHDYILLQFAGGKWIKAEKGGESAHGMNDAGIVVYPVDLGVPEDLKAVEGSSIRFQTNNIRLGKGKEAWSLARMLRLLSSGDPDYDVLAGNCWKHAHDCAEGVLNWCIENAEAEDVREALKAKLDELKKVERPGPRDLMRSVVHPSAPESVKARETFKQKLAHTEERLPKDSFRRLGVKVIRKVIDP